MTTRSMTSGYRIIGHYVKRQRVRNNYTHLDVPPVGGRVT
jgi:hypothetical protein